MIWSGIEYGIDLIIFQDLANVIFENGLVLYDLGKPVSCLFALEIFDDFWAASVIKNQQVVGLVGMRDNAPQAATAPKAQFAIGRVFAFQPEVLYSQRGAKSREDDPATKLDLNYVQIPLLLMARLGSRESPIYPILYAGPQVAFETRCQVTGESEGVSLSVGCDDPLLDGELETNQTEYGVVFGGGFEVLYSRLTVQLDVRYQLGLTNLNDAEDASDVSVKSRLWSFMLGFGVPM